MADPEETTRAPLDQFSPDPHIGESTVAAGPFGQVPIETTIAVGRARPLIRDLVGLARDSILPLDRRIEDPVELFVGDKMIARGTLTELEGEESGQLAVRLTEVADLGNGL